MRQIAAETGITESSVYNRVVRFCRKHELSYAEALSARTEARTQARGEVVELMYYDYISGLNLTAIGHKHGYTHSAVYKKIRRWVEREGFSWDAVMADAEEARLERYAEGRSTWEDDLYENDTVGWGRGGPNRSLSSGPGMGGNR